jgi:hypothetical protein
MYYLLFFVAVILFLSVVASREPSRHSRKVPIRRDERGEREGPR